ncbi:MAG: mycothione reductase [Actinomycetota bacterium]
MRTHDLIIIGAGSGNSIIGPEHDDMDVAIIERGLFGGTCLNVGCIPSKMFVYAAEVAEIARHLGPRLGVHTTFEGADWTAIRDRVFGRIDPIAAGGEDYRKGLENVTVYQDSAVFTGPKEIRVGDETITAKQIVIAAGARAWAPPIDGLDEIGYHTSDTIMRVDEMPKRLAVLGGGYIATELGNVFGMLGSEVTFIVRSDAMLRNEDEAISTAFTEAYKKKFSTRFMSGVYSARRDGDEIVLDLFPDHEELRVDAVLVATGRIPNGDELQLAEHGYELDDDGYLVTDSNLRTNVDGVFALGDITNPVQLKHVANHEARVVKHNLANPDSMLEVNHAFIPHAVFGHPQVASVGMTERDAIAAGVDYTAHVQHYASAAYGWAMEDTDSIVKLIMDSHTRLLLGAHICGPQASTLIQQLIQGMAFGQTVDQMAKEQYYIHPALPEVIEQALLEL